MSERTLFLFTLVVANNPMRLINPTGMDWFVNNENGSLFYLKGVTELIDKHREKYNMGSAQYENLGADNSFGSAMDISKIPSLFRDENTTGMVTDQPFLNLGPYSEVFMNYFGYKFSERVRLEEIKVTTKGDAADRLNTMETYSGPKQIRYSELTYAKPNSFFQISGSMVETVGGEWYSFSKIETATYNVVKPFSYSNESLSYFREHKRAGHLSDVFKSLSRIFTILENFR